MTAARLISPDTRSALLVALGATLLAIPFVVGLSLAAVAAGIVVGAVVLGLGLAGTAPSGRGTIPLSTQKGFDQGLVIGLLLSSFAFAFVGDSAAALLYGLTGSIQLFITAVTRYSAPRQHETSLRDHICTPPSGSGPPTGGPLLFRARARLAETASAAAAGHARGRARAAPRSA